MKDTSPGILILGGGVAGMSAALALKDQDLLVHLVEKEDRLGGHAASWACMATDTCQNCGACLSLEMADQVCRAENISIHLGTQVTGMDRTGAGMRATLSSGQTLDVAKTVLATGFTPFDPETLPSYHTPTLDRVITTARLNTLLREDKLTAFSGPAPKIAFLQCVGSRDRSRKRDYCSQVCCKISMRHAQKIRHIMPKAEISLFYMDLQVVGKEARTLADRMAGQIRLVQGVPAEILEHPESGGLTMVTEDPVTGTRQSMVFDIVVLSVGMVPGQTALNPILGARPNVWGFFNTKEADPGKNIYVAGCARSPGDIPSAIQEGRIVGAQVLNDMNLGPERKAAVAVMGDGAWAGTVANCLADRGYTPLVFGQTPFLHLKAQDLSTATILAVDGFTGHFSIFYQDKNKKQTINCKAIIAAPGPKDLDPGDEIPGAVTLSAFQEMDPGDCPDNMLILLDYYGPESKARAGQALTAAIKASEQGRQVDILMNKMLVHGPKGQQRYDQARNAGIRFLRYNAPEDLEISPTETGPRIRVREASLPGLDLVLTPSMVIVPRRRAPGPGFPMLARQLRLGLDTEGFLQPANTRHRPVGSQRKGIYFAGPGHDDIDGADLTREIRAILADLETRVLTNNVPPKGRVAINETKCAKCLTCYRVCPHGAIILNENQRPQIMDGACFQCQACLSSCPAYAIDARDRDNRSQDNPNMAARARKGKTLVFACERSGILAAKALDPSLNEGLVSLPCACRISPDMILGSLIRGADRVIVSPCHEGNCRSGDGSAMARKGVAAVAAMPGIPDDKVVCQPVAANEPNTLAKLL